MAVSDSTAERYMRGDPDVRRMLAVGRGDAEAFEVLMDRYNGRVRTVLTHLVGNRDQAEDLAQDVFLRVFRARASYQPGARFSTWLFTIVHNVAKNALVSKARRREVHLAPHDGPEGGNPIEGMLAASSGQMPARRLDKVEIREIVRLAVGALNERQRMAVLLTKFEGMSHADVAEVMSLSPQAVKSLICRARVNLRDVLEPYFQRGKHPDSSKVDPTLREGGS